MKRFLTLSVVAATIAWSLGLAGLAPQASAAYSPADGDIIKTASNPAVYYISGGKRYLFSNRVTYGTWFADFSTLKVVSQADFDAIPSGGNVTARPGVNLIKFDNSATVYAVAPGNKICKITSSDAAKALYGDNWSASVVTIQVAFESNYTVDPTCELTATSKYPAGSLIKASGSSDVYYWDGTNRRLVSSEAFIANGFKSSLVRTVADITAYGNLGAALTGKEAAIGNPTTTGSSTSTGTGTTTGGSLSVALAADTPAAKNLASGTAYNTVLKLALVGGSQETKVTGITITKTGLVANSNISGISVWDQDGNKHGDVMTSIGSDNKVVIGFASYPITVPAGQTKTLSVAFSISAAATSGTVGAKVESASDISSDGAVTGSFPISGNEMGIVDGSSALSSVTVAAQLVGGNSASTDAANVEIGETKEVAKIKFTENTGRNDVALTKLTFYVEGNAKDTDLKDFTLLAPDNTVLGTVAQAYDKYVTVNLSSPYIIPKGTSRTLTLKTTIANGSGNYFRIQVQSEYDVLVKDNALGYFLVPADSSGGTWSSETASDGYFKMKSGTATVSKASDSPSGFISAGATDIVLASFDVKAIGEDIELRKMGLQIATTSESYAKHLTGTVKVKSGDSTLFTVSAGDDAYTLYNSASTQYTMSQYLTIKAGETKNIKVIASVNSNATSTSDFTAKIGNFYMKRLSTLDYVDNVQSTLVSGNNLTVQSTAVTVAKDSSMANKTVATGSKVEIGKFVVKAGSAEGIKLTNVNLKFVGNGSFDTPSTYQNLELWNGSTQLGSTISSVATSSNSFSFSLSLAKDEQKTITVKANVLSTAVNGSSASTTIDSYSYSGVDTNNSFSVTDDVAGQVIAIGAGSAVISSVSDDSSASTVLGPSSEMVQVGKWKITANNEDLTLKKITFMATDDTFAADTTVGNFGSLALYEGSTKLGDCVLTLGDVVCSGLSLVVPANDFKTVTLKSTINNDLDEGSINSFVVKSNSAADLEIQASSGLLASSAITASSVTSTYYRFEEAVPTVAGVSVGTSLNLSSVADVFKFSVTNNGGRAMKMVTSTVTINASGLATGGTIGTWKLWDSAGNLLASTSTDLTSTTVSLAVIFNVTTTEVSINPGDTKTFTVTADTTNAMTGKTSGTVTLSGSMTGNTQWSGSAWGSGSVNYQYMPVGSTTYSATRSATKASTLNIYGSTLSRSI